MPSIVQYTPAYLNQVTRFIQSVDPSNFQGGDTLVFDDRTNPTEGQIAGIVGSSPMRYLKVSGGTVVEMTQTEKNQVDADIAAAILSAQRAGAKVTYDSSSSEGKILKALVLTLLDEINTLRMWTRTFKTETAAATNLANFQSRVATLPTLADRTAAQAKTAIENKIDTGSAD